MVNSKKFSGALVVKEDGVGFFYLFVFDKGKLEYDEVFDAKDFQEAEEYSKAALDREGYENKRVELDEDGEFSALIEEILENQRLVFESSYDNEDEDDYDGSLASYWSDPNHWPD